MPGNPGNGSTTANPANRRPLAITHAQLPDSSLSSRSCVHDISSPASIGESAARMTNIAAVSSAPARRISYWCEKGFILTFVQLSDHHCKRGVYYHVDSGHYTLSA